MGMVYSAMLTAKRLGITPSQYIKLRHLMLVCEIDARVVWQIRREFNSIDIDRSGQITAMELFNHYAVTDTEFNRRAMSIMDDQDCTSKMSLDLLEYIAAVYNYCTYNKENVMTFIFHIFDEDRSGYLELPEFVALVHYVYGRPLTERVQDALDQCDFTATGQITQTEFLQRCREFPMLIAPAFALQEVLHNSILGPKFWKHHIDRRIERADNLLLKLQQMNTMYMEGGALQHVGDSMRAEEVAKSICQMAIEKGSPDNVSVVIIYLD